MINQHEYREFISSFTNKMYHLKTNKPFSDYVFLCVGSDKVIGDAFGPLVGSQLYKLLKNHYTNIHIIGTLDKPVLGTNLKKTIFDIEKNYANPCIIAIDSALSKKEDIGKVFVSNEKMKFAKGTRNDFIEVGNISVKGVVAQDCKVPKYNFSVLQNTPLGKVLNLAQMTANGIFESIKYK